MTKAVKKYLIGMFCSIFCLLIGFAFGLQTWNTAKADELVSYTSEQLATYDVISVKDICGAETYTVPAAANSYYEEEKGYTASEGNTTRSTVFKFKLGINTTADIERLITLRKAAGNGYRFWFGVSGTKVRIGTMDNWTVGNMYEPVDFITGAPSEYEVEIGAIDLLDGSGVWQYVKINDELVLSAKQPLISGTAYPHVCVGGNDTAAWTLTDVSEPEQPDEPEIPQLPTYTDEELAVYDVVSVKDICGAETYTVPAAANSYYEEEKGYTASEGNTTRSTVFKFKLGINTTADIERLITLRKAAGNGYRFWFGVSGTKVRIGTMDNWTVGNMYEPVDFITGAPSEYEVEIGAIDLLDGSGVWQYVKINDELVLSAKQPLISGTAYPHVCVGGNDTAAWTLTDVSEPEQPDEPEIPQLPTYTDEELAVYDVVSVKEVFGRKELVLFGGSAYQEQEMPYVVSAENTTNSVVFKFTITHTELETTEKLITLRSALNGSYGYRFYMQALKTAVCNNWTGIESSITNEVAYATEVNALYDIEIGAIDLADGSGVWQYVKLNGELIHSNVREVLSTSAAAIRVGTNAVSNWSIRDIDYDNLPEEEAPVRTGITTEKSELYDNVTVNDLEDLLADVAYLGLGFGAAKTEEGNIRFERVSSDDRTPLIELKPKTGVTFANNFAVKFASINNCVAAENAETVFDPLMKEDMKKNTAIELGLELCATNMGTYWTAGCGYLAYLVWDAGNDIYRIAFYPQGPEASTSGVTAMDLKEHPAFSADFLPIGERYTVEFGCFSEDATKSLTMYVLITNASGEEMYIAQTWDSANIGENAANGGYVRISALAYERCASVEILPVAGEGSLLSQYAPVYDEALKVVDHDISDYMPIGQEGITYTTTSADDSKNIINVRKFIVNTKNDMYLKFAGDYNLRMAFFTDRSEDKNCSAGYHVIFTPNAISVQSYLGGKVQANETIAYTMPLNEKVHVSVRVVQLYIEGVIQGVRLSVFINGEEKVSGDFALQLSTLPAYFDGIMSGNGSVTIYPYDTMVSATNGITLDLAKTTVSVGKQIKLDYEVDKEIVNDSVSYKIISGEGVAELKTNVNGSTYLVGLKDGKVKVVACIINEYGTFESETVEITVGTGEVSTDNLDNNGSKLNFNGCFGSIGGLTTGIICLLVSGCLVVFKKKED